MMKTIHIETSPHCKSISIRVHPGSRPADQWTGTICPGVSVQGSIGTTDPAIWVHQLRIGASKFQARLKHGISHTPRLHELLSHYERYKNHPETPWQPVPKNKKNALQQP